MSDKALVKFNIHANNIPIQSICPKMKKLILLTGWLIFTLFLGKSHAQNLCDSLILYYPCSGNAHDASGHGFDGIVSGATLTADRNGNPNSAYTFRGNTDYINLPQSPVLKPQFPFSVSSWVFFNKTDNLYQVFTSDYYTGAYSGCWIGLTAWNGDTVLNMSYGDGGMVGDPFARRSKIGTTHINKEQWYHVVAVFRGPADMDLYLDGVNEQGTYDGDGTGIYYTNHPGSIGRHCFSTYVPAEASYMNGKLDEIAFWNRALTQEDITELFTVGIGGAAIAGFGYQVQGLLVSFSDQSQNAATWHWDFGDGTFSSLPNPVHQYAGYQSYIVTMTATNHCGSTVFTDTVNLACPKPIAKFIAEIHGQEVQFLDTSSSATEWYWTFGDGAFSLLENPVHRYENEGNYTVCLTVRDSCGVDHHCDTISLWEPLQPIFTFEINDNFVRFRDVSGSNTFWNWDFGDGSFSVSPEPMHYFSAPGTYNVCLTCGNSTTTESRCETVSIFSTGSAVSADDFYNIYPNPATSKVSVKGINEHSEPGSLMIFNSRGSAILSKEISPDSNAFSFDLDISGLDSSLYFMKIVFNEKVLVRKFLVIHS